MRLYVTPSGRWAGTQTDAVKIAREADAGHWTHFEVPTDKPGLLAFLNERRVRADSDEQLSIDQLADLAVGPIVPAPPPPPAAAPAVSDDQRRWIDTRKIADFILDEASVAQVEQLMGCIGTRVAELAQASRK